MRFQISGQRLDLGDALSSHVKDELTRIMEKYAQNPTEALVTFSKDGHQYVCDSLIHLPSGISPQASGRAADVYSAFDASAERLETQIRRYRRRLKDHHKARTNPIEIMDVSSYILASSSSDVNSEEPESLQPVIVAESETQIRSFTVGEAVMQMELSEAPVLVFRNEGHGGINVVYIREDGNIGWVDPK